MKLETILKSQNVAKDLDDETLLKIGNDAVCGYENDLESRRPWEQDLKTWTDLALQISTNKTFPWPNAANIKYPLLATAAMQFAARAYPTLVPSNGQIVKCRTVGYDEDGQKSQRASRISKHMSYQLIDEMDDWEEDMDKLLIALPIAGTCFKKTYWDAAKQRNCSKLVLPKTLVVNYYCKSLDEAERVSETIFATKRKITERINQGVYLELDLGDPQVDLADPTTSVNNAFQRSSSDDETTPYTLIEQHTYLDLDKDGYSEPYVLTVDLASKKVLRIVPRFSAEDVILNDKEKVVSIEAIQYYTKYSFTNSHFVNIGLAVIRCASNVLNGFKTVNAGSICHTCFPLKLIETYEIFSLPYIPREASCFIACSVSSICAAFAA